MMASKGKEISSDEREIVVKLFKEGKTYREIGRTVGRTHSSIQRVVQNFQSTGVFVSRPRSGRPPILASRETPKVLQSVQKNSTLSATQIAESVKEQWPLSGQRQRVATTSALPEAQFEHTMQNEFNFSDTNKRIKLEASEYDEYAVFTEDNFQNANDKEIPAKSMPDNNNIDVHNDNFSMVNITHFKMQQEMSTNTTESCVDSPEEDSDRMFLLSLLPYLRKVKDQRKLQVRQKLQDVLIEEFG